MENNDSNTLSQEEIDKLAGNVSDNTDNKDKESNEKPIDINNMLSEEELNSVAENLNELSEINSEPEINLSDESGGLLSQEEINRLADEQTEEPVAENTLSESSNTENEEPKIIEKEYDDENKDDTAQKDTEKEITEAFKAKRKKTIIIISIISIIILSISLFFVWDYIFPNNDKKGIINDELADGEDVFIEQKVNNEKEKDINKINKKKIEKKPKKKKSIIEEGIELFFKTNKKGIDDLIMKSEELIVNYDMDISEENLKLCLAFDLSSTFISLESPKESKKQQNDYFRPENLNKKYMKRLKNLGYDEDEAKKFILENGKKIIKELRKRIKNRKNT